MLNTGLDVSRSSIIHHVWKLSSDTLTNVVDVYINYLRRKIDVDAPERLIHTVRGAGYRLGARSIPARTAVGGDKRLRTPAILVGANSIEK
jgi:DNA-binding response OmpR family regulator